MKKIILLIIALFSLTTGYSQSNWYYTSEFDFVFPGNKNYDYSIKDNIHAGGDTELVVDGFLLTSFGVQADYNYMLFDKLSIGVLTGFQMQTEPDFEMIKLGAVLRYFFVDKNNVYVYLQDANNFSLNKNDFYNGNNFRVGIGFPIIKRNKYNILLNLFWEQNFFKLDNANPLLELPNEIPKTLSVKSVGLSFGVQF